MNMDFNEIQEKMTNKKLELEFLLRQFNEKLKEEFHHLIAAFFEETGVQAVCWTQYTPYFNDGEECIFEINDIYYVLEGFNPEELENPYNYEDDDLYKIVPPYRRWSKDAVKHPLRDICDTFSDIIRMNEGLMKDMFGDHTAVYLTKDSVLTEEYDHD